MAKKKKTIRAAYKRPKELGKTYNAADINKVLKKIEALRKELKTVPMNEHYRDKKAGISKQINTLKRELWVLEVKKKPKE